VREKVGGGVAGGGAGPRIKKRPPEYNEAQQVESNIRRVEAELQENAATVFLARSNTSSEALTLIAGDSLS
jgi:hypothetical protein